MFSWFRKKVHSPEPSLAEGLAALEQAGISKGDDVSLDDILFSTGGTAERPVSYPILMCTLGGQSERRKRQFMSDDIWHFDTECICEDGDYARIAERLQRLSKGALKLSALKDHVDLEESEAWIEFDHQGQRVRWDVEVDNDWVDAAIFTRFVELFAATPSEARFTYGDLGGQDCLIGFSTEEQRKILSDLSGIKFEWLR